MPGPNFSSELFKALKSYPETRRILIAYSGGLDSRVLLYLAATNQQQLGCVIEAVHIDHGLQSQSAEWASTCYAECEAHGVKCHVLKAELKPESGQSIEALARDKRYELFATLTQEHDLLMLAQHADDQAETVLLQLLRGAGPEGLSAMPYERAFFTAHLIRPLLQFSRAELEAFAHAEQLQWIEDPSNSDERFDRNYLRKTIFPLLEQRFPGYRKTLARSAKHCASLVAQNAGAQILNHQACLKPNTDILSISALVVLSPQEQAQVLRSWIKSLGCKAPQTQQLSTMLDVFCCDLPAPLAAVSTADYHVRRYQDGLYLLPEVSEIIPFKHLWPDTNTPLRIKELGIELTKQMLVDAGIELVEGQAYTVRSRENGAKLRPAAKQTRRSIKNLFQENAIPPWERDQYPFIYQGDKLVAVLGLCVDAEFQSVTGLSQKPQINPNMADS